MDIDNSQCEKCLSMLSSVVERVRAGDSCRECGRYRFQSNEPSYLYLLTHPILKLHQVGIGTIGKDKGRLEKLLKEGWVAFGIWHGDKGKTFQWEKKVFALLKERLQPVGASVPDPMGTWVGTWAESISADAISASEIEKIISKIIKE